MASKTTRLIVLAGAPEHDHLQWEEAHLTCGRQYRMLRFLGEFVDESELVATPSQSAAPKWRQLPLSMDEPAEPAFAEILPPSEHEAARADFFEHSFAISEPPPDIQPAHSTDDTTILDSTTDPSFSSTSTLSTSSSPLIAPSIILNHPITPLSSLPNAAALHTLHPHTPTATLLVGVIHAAPPRPIVLRRRRNLTAHLLELLVGDETRAAVAVNFWLDPPPTPAAHFHGAAITEDPRQTLLRSVRAGDVLLLRHVALASYRGVVYGSGVRSRGGGGGGGGMGRTATRVERIGVETRILGGGAEGEEVLGKVGRVREWLDRFVGTGGRRRRGWDGGDRGEAEGRVGKRVRRNREEEQEALPPDTQITDDG